MVPSLDVDDLVGDGSIGLIRAVDSFDPLRGPQLDDYARRLIVGAMLNGIRRMDPVSERARRIVRDGENRRYALAAARRRGSERERDGAALPRISASDRGGSSRTAALARRSVAAGRIAGAGLERRSGAHRRAPIASARRSPR